MNQYRPPAEWTEVVNNSFDKCQQAAKQYRVSTAFSVVLEPIKRCVRSLQQYRIADLCRDFFYRIYYRFLGLDKGIRLAVGGAVAVIVVALLVTSTGAAPWTARSWEGTWTNRSYNSGGTLTCVAREVDPGKWEGTFTGVWKGDPFKYKVSFTATPGRAESLSLSGTANIDDHNYRWTGMMRGKTLRGRYNSTIGYSGEFVLNEK